MLKTAIGVFLGGLALTILIVGAVWLRGQYQEQSEKQAIEKAAGIVSTLTEKDVISRCGKPENVFNSGNSRTLWYGKETVSFLYNTTEHKWEKPYYQVSDPRDVLVILPCLAAK